MRRPRFPFTPQDALEFMQKMWNPLGIPIPGFGLPRRVAGAAPDAPAMPFPNPAMMFAALDPAEIDRKITELRIVENWLVDEPEHDADEHQDARAAEGLARGVLRRAAVDAAAARRQTEIQIRKVTR